VLSYGRVLELLSSFRHLSANIVFLDIMNRIQTLKKEKYTLIKEADMRTNEWFQDDARQNGHKARFGNHAERERCLVSQW
jgi:hypothetical protein